MATKLEIEKTAKQAVKKIWADLNDRSGIHLDSLDGDIQKEIRATMAKIIATEFSGLETK